MTRLILTVTRRCNCRCSYCPTSKEGWPELQPGDGRRAVELLATRYGGGEIQVTGGEPLLLPDVVRAVLAEAGRRPEIRRVSLCTNGLLLDRAWLSELGSHDKAMLLVSLDGRPDDHRRHRAALDRNADSFAWSSELGDLLASAPRVVVTQTIAPDTAADAAVNFAHLLSMGFKRFKFLPVYYRTWLPAELDALRRAFEVIGGRIREHWAADRHLYVANLFTWAPTPLFHTGLVVDADRSIHVSNAGQAAASEQLLHATRVGTLDHPPGPEMLEEKAEAVPELLERALDEATWHDTQAVDAELSRLCRSLYPDFLAYRARRRAPS
ncbi:MAG: radical SAM protein [Deltaproteobacteria bacterium]|nr:radical SAM protein [Deltaproteobacteria bacterium]MBW2532171.1 radical SAM protein [Deltaproteobacteria bacterium]